jgi:peptidoglycan LD-endopeptidase LytH
MLRDRAQPRSAGGRRLVLVAVAVLLVGCASDDGNQDGATSIESATATSSSAATSSSPSIDVTPTSTVQSTTTAAPTTTEPPAASTDATSTILETTTAAPTTAAPTTPAPASTTPPPAVVATYVVPVSPADQAGWNRTHSGYPATDIFLGGCGGTIVAPTDGTVLEVRRTDFWDPAVDNPATRGGRSFSMLGDDGVRYYMAHFETIAEWVVPGERVTVGTPIGTIGTTGRSSACHVHFAISPPCPGPEWSVRRGVVWPYPYLDDWRAGGQTSPAAEVAQFLASNPNACAEAMADPYAADS